MLECLEPALHATVSCGVRGQLTVEVNVTPDNLMQAHRFTFELDQSYLPRTISGCHRVLARFPIRGDAS
jgi:hypothetical protein